MWGKEGLKVIGFNAWVKKQEVFLFIKYKNSKIRRMVGVWLRDILGDETTITYKYKWVTGDE